MTPMKSEGAWLDLYWIPLGAGQRIVRSCGRVYEALAARTQHRPRCALFHSALVAHTPDGEYFIEVTPVPAHDDGERGVIGGGAVGSRLLGWLRVFRYELRCWRDGVIPDIGYAVDGPVRISDDADVVQRTLTHLPDVPTPVWGRDELRAGEMWNSNSVISWVLARAGVIDAAGSPPGGGRAPGWDAGALVAGRSAVPASAHRGLALPLRTEVSERPE